MSTKTIREIALLEEWRHEEHTCAVFLGPDRIAQFSETSDTHEGLTRRNRAHLAAAAPDLVRAITSLLEATSNPQKARAHAYARKALAKAGVESVTRSFFVLAVGLGPVALELLALFHFNAGNGPHT